MKKEMPFFTPKKKETFNLKREIIRYAKKWKWFLGSIILCLTLGYYITKYSPTIYETSARVKIINQQENNIELPGNLSSLIGDEKVNLENEIEIIKSYRILEKVSRNLELNVRYYRITETNPVQVWNSPIKVHPLNTFGSLPVEGEYVVKILEKGYEIKNLKGNKWKVSDHIMMNPEEDLPFLIKVDPIFNKNENLNQEYKIRFFTLREATLRLFSGLNIEHIGKNSEVLKISLLNESSAKSEAILNEIIAQFNEDGVEDRKVIFQRTIDFVDERFQYLTQELDSIEIRKKQFKQNNKLTNIELDTEHNLSDKSNSNSEKINLETQLEIARILRKTLTDESKSELLPADIGLGISGINDQVILYNQKLLDFNKLKISGGSNNPLVKNLYQDIKQIKSNIFSSVVAYQKKTQTALKNIEILDKKNTGFFTALPNKEKILREIEREQSIKENLFIFLLQKREEAAINLVITAPSLKVVDYAITNLIPVSESPKMVFLKAFVAGFVLPFIVLYLIFFVDTRMQSKEDVVSNLQSSEVICEIPETPNKKLFSGKGDNSALAEGFRMLRTNIGYVFKKSRGSEPSKVIMVTSSKEFEGKTFCALNLAISYAVLNKKVLLIDTNFRDPKIQNFLRSERKNKRGLSDYLQYKIDDFSSLISSFGIGNTILDILTTGELPLAPAELLANGRIEELIDSIKDQYDYIILDTTPTSLVTDTLLISEVADLTLYITKAYFTKKKDIAFAEELVAANKLKNVCYIYNGAIPHRSVRKRILNLQLVKRILPKKEFI